MAIKKFSITMQKAMKIRKEMKTWLNQAQSTFQSFNIVPKVNSDDPALMDASYEEVKTSWQNDNYNRLEKMSVDAYYDKILSTMEQLMYLNQAIELANQTQHLLLIEENYHKSMLSFLDNVSDDYVPENLQVKKCRNERVSDTEYKKVFYEEWEVPLLTRDVDAQRLSEKTALNKCRDNISYLDATTKIDVEIDESWI